MATRIVTKTGRKVLDAKKNEMFVFLSFFLGPFFYRFRHRFFAVLLPVFLSFVFRFFTVLLQDGGGVGHWFLTFFSKYKTLYFIYHIMIYHILILYEILYNLYHMIYHKNIYNILYIYIQI